MNIVHGVCVSSWDKIAQYVAPNLGGRPMIGISGQTSIAAAYNRIIDACRTINGLVLILQHDDLEIIDSELEAKIKTAFADPRVAIVGVIGAKTVPGLAWWNGGLIGHQFTDSGLVSGSELTGDASCVDGSFIALSGWALSALRFDIRYPGFHGYDCDLGLQARKLGMQVSVIELQTRHHSALGFKSEAVELEWQRCDSIFQDKWRGFSG